MGLVLALTFGCAEGVLDEPPVTTPKTSVDTTAVMDNTRQPTSTETESGDTVESQDSTPSAPELKLKVEAPARGAQIDESSVRVAGRVSGLTSGALLINGDPVQVGPSGEFTAVIPLQLGLNRIVTEATEGNFFVEDRRAIIHGAGADPNAKVPDSVTVHMGARGLGALGRVVGRSIESIDLGELIRENGSGDGNFKVKRVRYDAVSVDIQPQQGKLRIKLEIERLKIEFRGKFNVLFVPVVVHGDAESRRVKVEADLLLTKAGDGSIGMQLQNPVVDLSGFDLDIENVANFITDLFNDTARGEGEKLLKKSLEEVVVPSIFDDSLLEQEIEIMGKSIGIDLDVQRLGVDANGLTMVLASQVSVPTPVRNMGIVPLRSNPGERSGDAALQIAASIDFINRLLIGAWSSGALDLEISSEDGLVPGLGVPLLRVALGEVAEGLDNDTPLTLRLRPLLPPVARIESQGPPLNIGMGDLLLDIIAPSGVLVTLSLDLDMNVGLTSDGGSSLVIEPEFQLSFAADVAETPMGPVNESALENQLETIAQLLPAVIADQTFALEAAPDMPLRIFDIIFSGSTNRDWLDVHATFDAN